MPLSRLAFDFGTSNSAVAMHDGLSLTRIPIEADHDTLPTAVFFPEDGNKMLVGRAASEALIDGLDGRYMRALKSILGTSLFHQTRLIEGRRRTLADIVTGFIAEVKARAEETTGTSFNSVLSGRPVHFHTQNLDRDAQAEADLKACYHAAGFDEVNFLFEPEAAAYAYEGGVTEKIGLIVDIGGGTSDFSVFRSGDQGVEILGSHGIRLGGTNFDQKISFSHVMPLLGQGGELRRTFGAGLLPAPNAIYQELAAWAKIPFLYSRDTERQIEDLLTHSVEPDKMRRLQDVIVNRLGHDVAFAVEAGKIAANAETLMANIDLSVIEPALQAHITAESMTAVLGEYRVQLRAAMDETLRLTELKSNDIQTTVLVGGSSLMNIVSSEVQAAFPSATLQRSSAFTAVVDGLAIASARG